MAKTKSKKSKKAAKVADASPEVPIEALQPSEAAEEAPKDIGEVQLTADTPTGGTALILTSVASPIDRRSVKLYKTIHPVLSTKGFQ